MQPGERYQDTVLGGFVIQFFSVSELFRRSPKYDRIWEAPRFAATALTRIADQGVSPVKVATVPVTTAGNCLCALAPNKTLKSLH